MNCTVFSITGCTMLWTTSTGGFYGKIDHNDHVHAEALKGSVLNSRICWSFAAAFNQTKDPQFLPFAQRAYDYIVEHFIDPSNMAAFTGRSLRLVNLPIPKNKLMPSHLLCMV